MTRLPIACIVEGHGEVKAVPILIRRICEVAGVNLYPNILRPIRIPVSKLVKEGELEKAVEFAASKTGPSGRILIILYCDDGCPADMGPELLTRAKAVRPDHTIGVVLAKKEFESWFLASIESLRGLRGISENAKKPDNPESIRNAKGWLSQQMEQGGRYSPITDQPALTSKFDMQAALSADSFNKCYREIKQLILSPE